MPPGLSYRGFEQKFDEQEYEEWRLWNSILYVRQIYSKPVFQSAITYSSVLGVTHPSSLRAGRTHLTALPYAYMPNSAQ